MITAFQFGAFQTSGFQIVIPGMASTFQAVQRRIERPQVIGYDDSELIAMVAAWIAVNL